MSFGHSEELKQAETRHLIINQFGYLLTYYKVITLTSTSIILDITKTESNNCFIIHWTEKIKVMILLLHWRRAAQKRANLTWLPLEIMHRGHTYMTWLLVTLIVLDMIIV